MDSVNCQEQLPDVKKNFIYRTLYEILTVITPFITTPYVSRVLGADGIGIYSYTASIMAYFTLFAALGTMSYGEREIARHRDDPKKSSQLFWEIELMTVITTSICIIVWAGVICFSVEYRWYFLALLPLLFGSMANISWYFMGYERVKYIVFRNCFCKILGVLLLFLLVREKDDLVIYILMNSVITLAGNMSMWTYLPRMLTKVDFKTLNIGRHFRETLVYFIPTIATSIYTVLDKTLIGVITGNSYENGYYEQATKIINIVKSVVFTSVNAVMGSRISYLFSQKKYGEIHQRINHSMDFIMFLGYGAVFGMIGIANTFVPVFFGVGYAPVTILLYVMSPLVIIIGISNCLGSLYYNPAGLRAKSARVIILGSVINLFFNIMMIPLAGGVGAAIASVIAELAISLIYIWMSDGYMTVKALWGYSWKRISAGTIMCITVICIGKIEISKTFVKLMVQILAGGSVYGVFLLCLHDSMIKELRRISMQLLKRNTNRQEG